MDSINLLQWNCRSAVSNKSSLEYLLQEKNVNIASLSETWFKPGSQVTFSGYNLVRKDRPDGRGGVALLIKNNLKFSHVSISTNTANIAYIAAKIFLYNNTYLTIVSLYIKPNTRISKTEYDRFFSTIPKPFIIAGDFNCHNVAWGSDVSDVSGKILLDAIDFNNLVYLNNGSPTLVKNLHARKSAIDLTLCTPDIAGLLSWETYSDPCGSDHLPILIQGNIFLKTENTATSKKWRIDKADWFTFRNWVDTSLANKYQVSYVEFLDSMNEAANKSIPINRNHTANTNKRRHIPKPWWNETCQQAVVDRKQAYKNFLENPNLSNLLKYKKQDAVSKRTFKETKRNKWKEYCATLNKNVPIGEVWSKVNRFKNRSRHSSRQIISKDDEWVEPFFNSLAPSWVNNNIILHRDPEVESHKLSRKFTMTEINYALKKQKNTAPGIDNIHYCMLYNLPYHAKEILLRIYNSIWLNEVNVPDQWHEYVVIPIAKPGKPVGSPNSYRPISLASCIMKTYERLIKNRLEHWLESQNKLTPYQYGFRRGRSVQEVIAFLVSDIQLAYTRNYSISAACLDIKGAYDNVELSILSEKMLQLGLPTRLVANVVNMYSNRKVFLRINNTLLGPRITSIGLPQGSILSPLLYIIYSQDLRSYIDCRMKLLQFADDILLYSEARQVDETILMLTKGVGEAHQWAKTNGLTISAEKSSICTFTRKRIQIPPTISIQSFTIPYKTCIKYLGIFLDKNLNWKSQINYTAAKAENSLNILRAFCSSRWGSDPNIAILFFRSFTRSILDFGGMFYESACKSQLEKIIKVHNKGLRMCVGYLKSTPVIAMQAELTEPPTHLRHQYLADKFLVFLLSKRSEILDKLHSLSEKCDTDLYWRKKKKPLLVNSYMEFSKYNNIIQTNSTIPLYTKSYDIFNFPIISSAIEDVGQLPPHIRNRIFIDNLHNRWEGYQYIFTDGSKSGEKVGCAFYHSNENRSQLIRLHKYTSVFTAELIAIKEALAYCLSIRESKFIIFTDSKSSIEALKKLKTTSKTNYIIMDIMELNMQLRLTDSEVTFVWLRGHAEIIGNEKADSLAKQAAEQGTVINNKIPFTDLNQLIKKKLKTRWQAEYSEAPTGRKYKSIEAVIPSKPWFHSEINRHFISTISRIRSNHCMCQKYKYKISMATTEDCVCGEVGDLQHLFMECTYYNSGILVNEMIRLGLAQPFNLDSLLALNDIRVYRLLYKFLRDHQLEM